MDFKRGERKDDVMARLLGSFTAEEGDLTRYPMVAYVVRRGGGRSRTWAGVTSGALPAPRALHGR